MDWNYVFIGGAALLCYYIFQFFRQKNQIVKRCRKDVENVLNNEDYKVKGKYDD